MTVAFASVPYPFLPDSASATSTAERAAQSPIQTPDDPGMVERNAPEDAAAGEQMRSIARTIDQIADCDVTVLVRGESGVGKGLVARAIHERSTRRRAEFVKVNCAALPAELLESELFGHERGAFTGAVSTRIGKFEQADRGTILLDEIGDLTPALQAKLLHVLQDGEFTRLGSNKPVRVDVRVIAATNCNLEQMRVSGGFREDLYFRLGVIELTVPPLRERRDEVRGLADLFLQRFSREYSRRVAPLSARLLELFERYDWPGNVRELENMMKRIVVLEDEAPVMLEIELHLRQARQAAGAAAPVAAGSAARRAGSVALGSARNAPTSKGQTKGRIALVDDSKTCQEDRSLVAVGKAAALRAEHAMMVETLHHVRWNRRKAAELLGVSYKTLLNKMKACGLTR